MPWMTLIDVRNAYREPAASMRPRRYAVDDRDLSPSSRLMSRYASMRPRRYAVDDDMS